VSCKLALRPLCSGTKIALTGLGFLARGGIFCPLWNRAMVHRTSSPPSQLPNHVCANTDVQMETLYIAKTKFTVLRFHFLSFFPTVSSSTRPCVIFHNKLCLVVGRFTPPAQRLHWRTTSSQLSGVPISYTVHVRMLHPWMLYILRIQPYETSSLVTMDSVN
jgi:hypothetical protein